MAIQGSVKAIPLTNYDTAGLDPAIYEPINVLGIPQACFLIRIINSSNVEIFISYDGNVGHDVVFANSVIQLDFHTNQLKKGSQVFVRGDAPGVGFIHLAGYYVGA